MKNITEVVFILDRSGSMSGLEEDTIGGFNGMLKKQKGTEGETYVTTVLFDDGYEILHDRIPLEEVKPLTGDDYYVRGCTALLDAVGRTIDRVSSVHFYKEKSDKTIFIITTDGMENASREYTYAKIKGMIEDKKACGWEFLFLGANIDAVGEAAKIGICEDKAVKYTNSRKGVRRNYDVLGSVLCEYRASECATVDADWKDDII